MDREFSAHSSNSSEWHRQPRRRHEVRPRHRLNACLAVRSVTVSATNSLPGSVTPVIALTEYCVVNQIRAQTGVDTEVIVVGDQTTIG